MSTSSEVKGRKSNNFSLIIGKVRHALGPKQVSEVDQEVLLAASVGGHSEYDSL